MTNALPLALCAVFAGMGLWHFYWALGGSLGKGAAIPKSKDRPAFTPSPLATMLVGMVLLSFAVLVAASSGLIFLPVPGRILVWLCDALALVLFARAVGDFRLVGFFKRVHGSRFARLDSLVYSPLCLALSVGVFIVGGAHSA